MIHGNNVPLFTPQWIENIMLNKNEDNRHMWFLASVKMIEYVQITQTFTIIFNTSSDFSPMWRERSRHRVGNIIPIQAQCNMMNIGLCPYPSEYAGFEINTMMVIGGGEL